MCYQLLRLIKRLIQASLVIQLISNFADDSSTEDESETLQRKPKRSALVDSKPSQDEIPKEDTREHHEMSRAKSIEALLLPTYPH
jgi:hypothetical protein